MQPTSVAEKKALENLKTELQEGSQEITAHQKRIKVADRSDFGWAVVEAYDGNELVEDSADERRLLRVEKSAERKALKRKRRLPKGKENPSQKPPLRN